MGIYFYFLDELSLLRVPEVAKSDGWQVAGDE